MTTVADDNGSDDNGSDDNGSDDDDNVIVRYGILESRPEVITGTWVIGGQAYTVTNITEFETEHGGFLDGVCVKVKVDVATPTVAKELETEEGYKCTGRESDDDDDAEGELYGIIKSLPANGLLGDWVVGDKTFVVTTTTELKANNGVFTTGVTVKVEFVTGANDVHTAREIELKYGNNDDDDSDDDDDRYGDRPGKEGKSFGQIISRSALTGTWNIGGVDYLVDAKTTLHPNDDYQVGERVRVEYLVNDDGSHRATKIKETDSDSDVSNAGHSKLVGFVEAKPEGYIGSWIIAGVGFSTTHATRFEKDSVALGIDSYVSVEYVIQDNVRRVLEMEIEVPPGAGDDDTVGKVELGDDSAVRVAAQNSTITVDGTVYGVSLATMILENGGALENGVHVYVNSYTTANGDKMATMVRTVNNWVYLPLAQR